MTLSKARFILLIELEWELQLLSVGSAVVMPAHGEAVLHVQCPDGFRLGVLAVQQDERWLIMWSPDGEMPAVWLNLVAREVAATVRERLAA